MNWGIIGTGKIARAFAESLKYVEGAQLVAVASRSQKSAQRFANEFNIPQALDNYEAITRLEDVEIVYIATPHHLHYPNSLMCLQAGKHVLCEKPLSMTARQTEHLIFTARKENRFLMEGLWTHFLPVMQTVQSWILDNRIGDLVSIDASFGFKAPFDPNSRLFDLELGGGALYDIGIYPIALATHLVQTKPETTHAKAILSQTGSDLTTAMILAFGSTLVTSRFTFAANMENQAIITGKNGRIIVHPRFWQPEQATLITESDTESENQPIEGPGLQFEAMHVQSCISGGLMESPVMPLSESLLNMMIMEDIAQKIGLKYPGSITKLDSWSP